MRWALSCVRRSALFAVNPDAALGWARHWPAVFVPSRPFQASAEAPKPAGVIIGLADMPAVDT